MKMVLDGITFDLRESDYSLSLSDFIEAVAELKKDKALTDYLKTKYEGFSGIPFDCVIDEVLIDENQINNWICEELSLTHKQLSKRKNDLFVPFEIVEEMIISQRM